MKQLIFMITFLSASTLLWSSNAFAAKVEVTFKEYKSFYDVDEGNHTRSGFKDLLTKNFSEHFTELATKLPEDQTLKVEITDIDLAGHVRVGAMNSTRIVKSNYPPRLNFSYQLLDASGKVIKSDDVVIRDLGYLSNKLPIKYRHKLFGYEKKMLDDWFKKTFGELIIK